MSYIYFIQRCTIVHLLSNKFHPESKNADTMTEKYILPMVLVIPVACHFSIVDQIEKDH